MEPTLDNNKKKGLASAPSLYLNCALRDNQPTLLLTGYSKISSDALELSTKIIISAQSVEILQ